MSGPQLLAGISDMQPPLRGGRLFCFVEARRLMDVLCRSSKHMYFGTACPFVVTRSCLDIYTPLRHYYFYPLAS
ncbi:hypothetical protein ACSBR2_012713 [Camellia fascicularis]